MNAKSRSARDLIVASGRGHRGHQPAPGKPPGARAVPLRRLGAFALALALLVGANLPGPARAEGQCTPILSGLRLPVSSLMTEQGHLLISESGNGSPNSGRISIVDQSGQRRTLVRGLPSGPADVGDPSGPAGLLMRGRVLFLAMGTGNSGIMGPRPGTTLANPAGPSSPIFASVLAMYFLPAAEIDATGFTITPADQQALAQGEFIKLTDGNGNAMWVHMVTKFPNFAPEPLPGIPDNIALSNPFGIAAQDTSYYVTDGGRNLVWRIDRGEASEFVKFPNIPNPLFEHHVGGPFIQAVPTSIIGVHGKLLVTLFRGAPFATGVSTVEEIDASTGEDLPMLTGLTTAIDIIPSFGGVPPWLVLEMSASGPFFNGPGTLLQFDDPAEPPTTLADCLEAPTSMTLDRGSGTLYVTERTGKLVSVPYP
ncbi:ScyD/ScyE family protein [Dokdonella sp.]|uniref:ScyD/ScyE family protein n=1 Tax=Dokdonella sp. TaxID=2291710 RepID=UPI0031C49302|nr:ScyD/ScyE family protein [Dokdonella sp.]